ncbi:MAG: class B sortase [Lachnospiraceae bacterium]|nr:class B sortase [Ruminococcus sp.]MCM1276450.1 class B sortase [Lachnospiraceae bacterium]
MATNSNRNGNGNRNGNRNDRNYALEKFDVEIREPSRKRPTGKKKKYKSKSPLAAVLPQAKDSGAEKARKTLLLLAIAILIGTVAFLVWQLVGIDKGGKLNSDIASAAGSPMPSGTGSYQQPSYIANPTASIATAAGDLEPEITDLTPVTDTPIQVDFDYLRQQNPDTRAWIKITDTMINNPVLQSTDNSYYIDHDFNKESAISGAIFSSYLNTWDGNDDNTILFGHNMSNGEFFAYVMHYVPDDRYSEPLSFYKTHPTIQMATPEGGNAVYKIFAGIIVNTQQQYGEVFPYINKTRFDGVDDFNNYMIEIMDRSWFFTDVDLTYGDELLTLSTCYWPIGREVDTRWVLFARKVRDGESAYVDTSVATRNYQAKLFDYYYDVIESSGWGGSVWDRSKLLSY